MTDSILGNEGETPLEQSTQKTPEQLQHEHEQTAFKTHIETSGEQVPSNFADSNAWFDSLKEAQKQYTQGQQEIAELKQQIPPPQVEPAPVADSGYTPITGELRIPSPDQLPIQEEPETTGVDEATYESWGMEFAAMGEFSPETRNEIKNRTGFSDRMLNDYVVAQKARLRETYSEAASTVGGKERLDKIFQWAATSLSSEDMQGVNMGLASPTYEVTLRGLAAMYDSSVKVEKKKEPAPNPNLTTVSATETGILPYQNRREFTQERNDPKFQVEPRYRDMVQNRMAITDWNTLPV